jgi:hypothetical protein
MPFGCVEITGSQLRCSGRSDAARGGSHRRGGFQSWRASRAVSRMSLARDRRLAGGGSVRPSDKTLELIEPRQIRKLKSATSAPRSRERRVHTYSPDPQFVCGESFVRFTVDLDRLSRAPAKEKALCHAGRQSNVARSVVGDRRFDRPPCARFQPLARRARIGPGRHAKARLDDRLAPPRQVGHRPVANAAARLEGHPSAHLEQYR